MKSFPSSPALVLFALALPVLILHPNSAAQEPKLSALPAVAKADQYAAESIVVEHADTIYSMAADGTGWRQRTFAVRVQSEAAVRQVGVIGVPFAGSSEHVEMVYARVRRPDGTVVETPVTDAMDLPDEVTRLAPFYSDLKQKQLPVRNLRVGDVLEWQAKIIRTKAEAPNEFWGQEAFDKNLVALEETVELRVPLTKTVKVWSPTVKPVESIVGNERVYRWVASQLSTTAALKSDEEAKNKILWTAAQELEAKDGLLPTIAWTTFPSWEAVGTWYRGMEADRMLPSKEIKAKVAELTAGKLTEEEKVRAVYGYVATQIRYIGVAFGVGRYQPHNAAEVLENQYGDCKDKHTLLAAMLGVLGVKTDAVLIGAGIRFNPEVPSPAAFNHLITLATVGGQPVWLDATAEVAPYRMLVAVIRDHAALAVPDAGLARIERTPATLPFKPFQTMDAVGSLDKDGVSESKMTLAFRGDVELLVRATMRQIPPAQYDLLMQNMSQGMGYGGKTSQAEFSKAEDTVEPLTIHYDYHREKAGDDWDHLRTIAQLAPVTLPIPDLKDPPVRALNLGLPRIETSTATMKLPEGWTAELPEAVHVHSRYANWDQTYRLEKGTLYAERKVEILAETVPVADWKTYKKWTDTTEPGTEKYVQLRRPKMTASTTTETSTASAPSETAKSLVQSAYEAVARNEVEGAISMLDKARSLNPNESRLWLTYGYAYYRRAKWEEATAAYEKELALYPETYGVYPELAMTNKFQHKNAEAIAVARRWVTARPADPKASVLLVGLLSSQEDYAGAVSAGEAGIAGLPVNQLDQPKDEDLRFALGSAEMKAGMKQKGSVTLTEILKNTENSSMINSSAYELALAGEQLELGQSKVRMVLAKMADESKSWTLDERLATLRGKSQLMAATWDTLGYILFRDGKFAEAENYVQAAWMNRRDAEVGEHLGDLLAARGDHTGAGKLYKLAIVAIPATFNGEKRDKPTAQAVRLLDKLNKQVGGSEKDLLLMRVDGNKELVDLQKVPLGAAEGKLGTAEYKLLLSAKGVERALPVGEKRVAGGEEMLAKANLKTPLPTGSDARFVEVVMLNCVATTCDLFVEP
jgi:Flp pilus assembly protein TadD